MPIIVVNVAVDTSVTHMDLQDLDLNLLTVFREMLIKGSVSKVADSLDMSQPAVSHALNRLRQVLRDELFVRTSHGYVPTRYAQSLATPVAQALKLISDAINRVPEFNPSAGSREFTIALTDVGEICFQPTLASLLSLAGPDVTLSVVRSEGMALREEMERGHVDLAVGVLPDLDLGFYQRRLFEQRYVCLLRPDHPLARRTMTRTEFMSAEHIGIAADGTGLAEIDPMLEQQGLRRNVRIRAQNFTAIAHVVRQSDLIAVVPEVYARLGLEIAGVISQRCPVDLPKIVVNLLWHTQNQHDVGHQWLRGHVFDALSQWAERHRYRSA